MLKRLEQIGEYLRANIRYDLPLKRDNFEFFLLKNKKDCLLRNKIDRAINRTITPDDKL